MNRRLDTRVDSTLPGTRRAAERVSVTSHSARTKPAKSARSEHKTLRAKPRADVASGVSMDYQMGFTSGPSV